MKDHRTPLGALALIAFAGGCSSVPTTADFAPVQQDVKDRAGYQVQWLRDEQAQREMEVAINRLLQQTNLAVQDAVQIALLNNRHLQATYEELGLAQAAWAQAGLLGNPNADVALRWPTGSGPMVVDWGVTQNFLELLSRPLRQRVAGAEFEAAQFRVTRSVLETAGATQMAYSRLQADLQLQELWQQVAQSTGASFETAKRLRAAGNITALELAEEQAADEEAKLALQAAVTRVAMGRERLNALMGLWGTQTQWTLAPRLPELPEKVEVFDNAEGRAVESSLSLQAARADIQAAAHALGLSRATSLLPHLDAGVSAERGEGHWTFGPAVALPLPLWDQGQARKAAAQAQLRRRQQRYYAQAVDLRATARAAQLRVTEAHRRAAHYRAVVLPLHGQIVQQTQLQYNAMQVGVFRLLLAKRFSIAAAQDYVASLHDYMAARTALDLLLMGAPPPSADDAIAKHSPLLNPQQH